MKCKHCGYKYGWDGEEETDVSNPEGDFYRLPIKMEREGYYDKDDVTLWACPKCEKTFIYKF